MIFELLLYMLLSTPPVPVILDTDIAGDYDDVGAIAVLHALADKGEANILAVVSCNAFETTVPTISVLNTYFGRPDIPVGRLENAQPNMNCPQQWAQTIIAKYPHRRESEPATALYRKVLAAQPDSSVTIISVGFFTNLAALLMSAPDAYSPLNGRELVKRKVKQLVAMAASVPQGREYNVYVDVKSAREVFELWETAVVLSPFELGKQIYTGIPLVQDDRIQNSPVKDAYALALAVDKNTRGRMSWDQTAVIAAIRGVGPWFNTVKMNFRINDDGSDSPIPGDRFTVLELKPEKVKELEDTIEELMHHQP